LSLWPTYSRGTSAVAPRFWGEVVWGELGEVVSFAFEVIIE
jgi:hypothetical protein